MTNPREAETHLLPDAPAPDTIPATAGERFVVLRDHAQGGLGKVQVAHDNQLNREVALKVIRPDKRGSEDLRRRFLREAEITARLEHPGVVPVYALADGPDGTPYYAMRFIQGQTLGAAIRAFHASKAGFGSLAFRDLLARFVSVCQTLAFAHSKGIVHRDVKPANVMLGDYGETLVVDWGVASDGSEAGVVGTPAYMAPEQARGTAVTSAADIFALGAILYEMLTGGPPYAGADANHLLFLAQRGEVSPPTGVPPALAAICRHALARDPAGRYATATALADDVNRWLADEPVSVHVPHWTERLRRWARHHPGWTGSAVTALLVGVVGLGIGLGVVSHLNGQLRQANEEERAAREFAQQAIEDTTSPVALAFLEKQAELSPEQRAFLERVVASYEGFVRQPASDTAGRVRRARAYFNMGIFQHQLQLIEAAGRAFERACEEFAALGDEHRHMLGRAWQNRALVAEDAGNLAEARTANEEAIRLQRGLVAEDRKPLHRQELARTLSNYAGVLRKLNDADTARAASDEAGTLRQALHDEHPDSARYRFELAFHLNNVGLLRRDTGDLPGARRAYEQAIALHEQALRTSNDGLQRQALGRALYNLGNVLRLQGERAGAQQVATRSLALRRALAEDFPTMLEYRHEVAAALNVVGMLHREATDYPAARQSLEAARAILRQLVADRKSVVEYRRDLSGCLYNLGLVLVELNDPTGARQSHEAALALQVPLLRETNESPQARREEALTRAALGENYLAANDRPAARREFDLARAAQQRLTDEYPRRRDYRADLAATLDGLARWHKGALDALAARAALVRVLELRQELAAETPADLTAALHLGKAHFFLAHHYRDTLNPALALAEFDAAERVFRDIGSPAVLLGVHLGRATSLDALNRFREAALAWDAAVGLADMNRRPVFQNAARRSRVCDGLSRDLAWPLLWGRPWH